MRLELLWILYPVIEALLQKKFIFTKVAKRPDGSVFYSTDERPNYFMLNIIRFMVAIFFGAIVGMTPDPWWKWPGFLLYQIGVFWLIFDPILNKLRNMKPIFSYEGENSGWLKDIPYWLQAIISIIFIVTGWIVYNY